MALVNQPPILASSFAVNGDKNTIPTTNSGTEGLASLSLGFPPITQKPVSQGGIPPQRADFNGIFNLITNFLMFIQNGSIFAYSSSLDYQPPAIVYGNNALYRCIATNGANTSAGVQPLSNTSYWQPLIPVGGITVSGNTITVTNETGTQIQYTIDTVNTPPAQSDSSNKIVTSAWVKAYAPSRTGGGASGTWDINISGSAKKISNNAADGSTIDLVTGTMASNDGFRIRVGGSNNNGYAEIATKDDGSKPIYMRQYTGDFTTITRTATILDGSGNTSFPGRVTANGGFSGNLSGTATNATNATNATRLSNKGNISATTLPDNLTTGLTTHAAYENGYPVPFGNVINIYNQGKSQLLLEWRGDDTAKADPGHLYYRECRDNQNTWSNWKTVAFTSDNVASATKATQDSAGQTINTTYVKGVTANNATLTITKGNGSTSTTTVNNVSRAEYSDSVGANAGYSNDTKGSGLKVGLSQSSIYNNGFPFAFGNLISVKNSGANQIALEWAGTTGGVGRVAVRSARDMGVDTWSAWRYLAYTESPELTGTPTAPTPSTSDNGTRVATTAFVHSLLTNKFTASKATNGWWKDGNTGMIWQWGQEASYHDIMDGNYGSSGSLNFPISFPNKCLAVMPYLLGISTFCCVSVSSFTNTKITVHWDEWSSSVQSVKFGYLAIGY